MSNPSRPATLTLDGSYGEGGGQILRTALSLAATTQRPLQLINIRARRRRPGLMPQHLAAVRAAADLCGATLSGDQLGSMELSFLPTRPPRSGSYMFDIAAMAERGSAGSATLLLQTLLVPLAFAGASSTMTLRGGTHTPWSPPFDHIVGSYLPSLRRMGVRVDAELHRWGWYPAGGGEIRCSIAAMPQRWRPAPLELPTRGVLKRIRGRAVATALPDHIPHRMAERAKALLSRLDVPSEIEALQVAAHCPGTGIFLCAEYENTVACFSALGRPGKPSEEVAEEAVRALHDHHASGATIEGHLSDQLLLPLAFASGISNFTVPESTAHLETNAWTIGRFAIAHVSIERGTPVSVRVEPRSGLAP